MVDIQTKINESSRDFINIGWPAIAHRVGGGEIMPSEGVATDEFVKQLDTLGGVDAWQVLSNKMGIRGIASRVQWCYPDHPGWSERGVFPWNTFTIRWSLRNGGATEIDKRLYAIDHPKLGLILPALTIQTYIWERGGSGRLASVAAVRTRDLFITARDYSHEWHESLAPGGNKFRAVKWSALQKRYAIDVVVEDVPEQGVLFAAGVLNA